MNVRNIDIELNKFELPRYINKDSQYVEELNILFEKYIAHLKKKIPKYDDCINNVEENINTIQNALQRYFNAKHFDAYIEIKSILEKYINSPYIISDLEENYAFRGLAPQKLTPYIYKNNREVYEKMINKELCFFRSRDSDVILKKEEMFHIPFDKRENVSTQRFSMSGIPCLYLGVTSLVTWLELNMPDKEHFQTVSYKLPKNLKILNLCISQYLIDGASSLIADEKEMKCVLDYIEIFPLVMATSFKVIEKNRVFKSEYIISQLLMEGLGEMNIDGVAYLTKRMRNTFSYPQGVNIAITIPYT